MKKITRIPVVIFALLIAAIGVLPFRNAHAEEAETTGVSISLDKVAQTFQISSSSVYDESFSVNNDGESVMRINVSAAPYSYVYSNEEDLYKLGFSNETNYTQISRWITFKDTSGNYVEEATYSIEPKQSLKISYRVSTPASIPGGGQYAVIFARALSNATNSGGIRTEVSAGLVVYARSMEGETLISSEISELAVNDSSGNITATAKIKNTGNVDFYAFGNLKIEPIIGFSSYETPATGGRLSVIPEAELTLVDEWQESPVFGIYKAIWTVTANEKTEVYEKIIVKIPLFLIVIVIILLTIIIISVIMGIRRRKERRSRLSV